MKINWTNVLNRVANGATATIGQAIKIAVLTAVIVATIDFTLHQMKNMRQAYGWRNLFEASHAAKR